MLSQPNTQTSEPSLSMYRGFENSKRSFLYGGDVLKPTSYPRILVVDDDPIFGKIINRSANELGANVTFCQSIREFGVLGQNWEEYDVAIIDCDLGAINGCELVEYMEASNCQKYPCHISKSNKTKG